MSEALDRLAGGYYNTGDWNAGTNPGGLGGDGHRIAMVPPRAPMVAGNPVMLADIATVAGEIAASAETATAQVALAAAEADRALALAGSAITGTSVTLVTVSGALVGTMVTFATQVGKSWVPGMPVIVADASATATRYIIGPVAGYDPATGALALTVQKVRGSGASANWAIRVYTARARPGDVIRTVDPGITADGYVAANGQLLPKTGDGADLYALIGQRFNSASTVTATPAMIYGLQGGPSNNMDKGLLTFHGGAYVFIVGGVVYRGATLANLEPVYNFAATTYAVAHNGAGTWVVSTGGGVWVGNGNQTWTFYAGCFPTSVSYQRLVWSPAKSAWYAFPIGSGTANPIAKSVNGSTWTSISAPTNYVEPSTVLCHGGRIVGAPTSGAYYIASSDGGDTWAAVAFSDGQNYAGLCPLGSDATGNSWVFSGPVGLLAISSMFGSPTQTANSQSNQGGNYSASIDWDGVNNRYVFRSDNDSTKVYYGTSFPNTTGMTAVTRAIDTAGLGKRCFYTVNGGLVEYTAYSLSTCNASYTATLVWQAAQSPIRVRRTPGGAIVAFMYGWSVLISADGGETWTWRRAPITHADNYQCWSGEVSADGQKIVLIGFDYGGVSLDNRIVLWTSLNGGTTWARSLLGATGTNVLSSNVHLGYGNGVFVIATLATPSGTSKIYYAAEAAIGAAWSTVANPAYPVTWPFFLAGRWYLLGSGLWRASSSDIATASWTNITSTAFVGGADGTLRFVTDDGKALFVISDRVCLYDATTNTAKSLWSFSASTIGQREPRIAVQYGSYLNMHCDHGTWGKCTVRVNLTTQTVEEVLPPNTTSSGSVNMLSAAALPDGWFLTSAASANRLLDGSVANFRIPNFNAVDVAPINYVAL